MENQVCSSCANKKAYLQCGLCQTALCKKCAQFLESESFSFFLETPPDLSHSAYCDSCFAKTIAPQLEAYSVIFERAKEVLVYKKTQAKETRLIKRLEEPVCVNDCADHDETILRLAFLAAQANYNAIIDVQITAKKVRNGGYQTTRWSGVAIPAQVDPDKLVKDRSTWQNPN